MASSMVSADPSWNTFVIRNANGTGNPPIITENPTGYPGWTLFAINEGGQKAGWATNYMNGQTIGDIQAISITRDESVDGWGPYMNFWITDGSGEYAVLGNEPSNTGEWGAGTAYDTTWDVLKNATAKVYEYNAGFTLPAGPTFTFNDFAGYTIATPSTHWGGDGAPDELGASTYTAYGVNWVFGDTQSNYIGGYLVSDPTVVPVPGAVLLGILGLGVVGVKLRRFA